MPRAKGHNKWEIEKRNLLESLRFNSVLMGEDLELATLLLRQELNRRELPTEALTRAKELLERLEKWNRENLSGLENLPD